MIQKPLNQIKNHTKSLKAKSLEEIEKTKIEFREKTVTLILGGFGLVAALAWNEAIRGLFDIFFPATAGLIGKFIYAIIVTAIVAVISIKLKGVVEKQK